MHLSLHSSFTLRIGSISFFFFFLTFALIGSASERYTGPIIDAHLHSYADDSPMFGATHKDLNSGKVYQSSKNAQDHQNETLERLKRYNIVKAMLSTNEDWLAKHPERFIHGYGLSYTPEELKAKYKEGKLQVIGEIAPNYAGMMPDDKKLLPYFDLANELDVPIAFHLFPGGPAGGAYFVFPKTRARQVKPLALEDILLERPKMRIYIMHGGWPYIEDMKALMYAHPQVYVDIGVLSFALPRKEVHNYLKSMVDAGFGKRIMFGSDQMVWPEIIDMAVEDIQSADFLTLEQKTDIFYNNAVQFFRLFDDENIQHKITQD